MARIGPLLGPELRELIREQRWDVVRDALTRLDPADVAEILSEGPDQDDTATFRLIPRDMAGRVYAYLPPDHQEGLPWSLTGEQMRDVLGEMLTATAMAYFEGEIARAVVLAMF